MDDITLDNVLEMLAGVRDDIDFENEDKLIDNKILDSFDILSVISAIDDEFDIAVPAKDIVPDNFNSAESIYEMILELAAAE